MQIKDFRAQVKAAGDDQPGQFTALVSVFGNEDSSGDVVLPGAFTQTLAEWKTSGRPIPVIWSHDWSDPFSNIGGVLDAQETDVGLQVVGQLDLDNPKAVQVYNLLKSGRVAQFSFAYDIVQAAWVQTDDANYYELRELKLFEVGPCLIGANQETELLAIKAAALVVGQKEGRVLSGSLLEKVKSAHGHLTDVIAAADKANDDDAKSSPQGGKGAPTGASDQQDTSRPEDDPTAAAKAAADGSDGAAPVDRLAAEIAIRQRKEWSL